MLSGRGAMQGLDTSLSALLSGGLQSSSAASMLNQQEGGGHHFLGDGFGSAVFGTGLPGELGTEGSEDLITPATLEVQAGSLVLPSAAAPAPAAAAQAPLQRQQRCLFCSSLGSQGVCGPLRPAYYEGDAVSVHHLCAIWSPGCYLPEGSSVYVNLETEARRALQRCCNGCGQRGASITCSHPGCRSVYHLPCALGAPNVLLENETFELWCPQHSDTDNSDEDYAFTATRPRRQTGGGTGTKRQRASAEAQRPRTDWQKKDENTWLKVVPPWWCEHRTVHFATKVYKELFKSAGGAVLVDPSGIEWRCVVHSEARNDLRPQYTLRGAFSELWEALGISSGDTLFFKYDPLTGRIELNRYAASIAAKPEEGLESDLSDPSATLEGFAGRGQRVARQEASSEQTRGQSQQGSHPNRWMELTDGWNIKTVYKSTMAHQQCPIAGWLFKKLYGRPPGETDKAAVYDPDQDAEYLFDVSFIGAANVHYITGKVFGGWVRETGLQAGEQIRLKKDGSRVLIQRVPSDRKVRVEFTTKVASRSASLVNTTEEAAVGGAHASSGLELASPPTAEALEALDALVAAAGYAGTHGTPAIQAALAGTSSGAAGAAAAAAAAGLPFSSDVAQPGFSVQALRGVVPKRRRKAQAEVSDVAELLLQQQEQQLFLGRRQSAVTGTWQPHGTWQQAATTAPSVSLADWKPSEVHVQMYEAINQVLSGHQWTAEEQATLQRFRAKYAWLDGCGREVVFLTTSQLKTDRAALLNFVVEVGKGILVQMEESLHPTAHALSVAAPPADPIGGGSTSPFGALPATCPAPQPGQQLSTDLSITATATDAPALPLPLEAHLGLEAAASFNLDVLIRTDREAQKTPNPQVALGPAS